jgi:O-antigen ligase
MIQGTLLPRRLASRAEALLGDKQFVMTPYILARERGPLLLIRYTYYAFIFSIPFETVHLGFIPGQSTLSRLIGLLFLAVASLQPRLCFKWPPDAFWCFAVYLFIYVILGYLQDPVFRSAMITRLFMLGQMLILFWASYNLMRYDRVVKGTCLTLAGACLLLSVLQALGISSQEIGQGRLTAFGENANTVGALLSLGLLALSGLAYGRKITNVKLRLLFWLCAGILAVTLIRTGSRGAMLALMVGLLMFFLHGKSLGAKLKIALVALLVIGFLGIAAYQIEAVRVRWERTLLEGETAGRDKIFSMAWEMVKEKPIIGWGPVHHYAELGSRLRYPGPGRDPHNLYLWILTEVGIVGAIPFFAGVWLCGYAAWQARYTIQGVLPLAMVACLLMVNMSGSWHNRKLFWIVLAYALASRSYAVLPQYQRLPSLHTPLHFRTSLLQSRHPSQLLAHNAVVNYSVER